MLPPAIARYVHLGVFTLPAYGLVTFAATLTHQPDPTSDFPAYARYISTPSFLAGHLIGSIFGTILALIGIVALAAYLAFKGFPRAAAIGLLLGIIGNALILTLFGIAAFASPAIGHAYLAGQQNVVDLNDRIYGTPLVLTAIVGTLTYAASAIVLGVAVWRSRTLPRWSGVLYAASGPLIAIAGLTIGQAQTLGSLLLILGSAWIVWSIWTQRAIERTATEPPADPVVSPS